MRARGGSRRRSRRAGFRDLAGTPPRPDAAARVEEVRAARLQVAFCNLSAMGQPVKLSDSLVLDARAAGLGRAVELLLRGDQILDFKQRGVRSVSECLQKPVVPRAGNNSRRFCASVPFPIMRPPREAGIFDTDRQRWLANGRPLSQPPLRGRGVIELPTQEHVIVALAGPNGAPPRRSRNGSAI